MSKRIGIIGDKDVVMPFGLFGFSLHYAQDEQAVRAQIREFERKDYAVILIAENWAEKVKDLIDSYKERITPAIILIPSHHGTKGIGLKEIAKNVEKAVGQNIL